MLAKDRASLEQKITLVNKLLSETASKTQKSRGELAVLNNQIKLRGDLIQTLSQEIESLGDEIVISEEKICWMEEDLVKLRKNYGQIVRVTYQNMYQSSGLFSILSAKSFSEMFYRIVYFKQIANYRKKQIETIFATEKEIQSQISIFRNTIAEKETLILEKQQEMEKLEIAKGSKAILYQELKSQESEYRNQLASQQSELKEIIENLNLADIPAPKIATKNNNAPAGTGVKVTPYLNDGKSFDKKKGNLPWPIPSNRAVVIGKFGAEEDEYGNHVTNEGIFLRTPQGQEVFAIHEGVVSGVTKVPLSGSLVILAHGNFRTAYINLIDVKVKSGDAIKAGQVIGTVRTDPRTDEAIFQFMLMQNPKKYLNPLSWLAKE